MRRITLILSFAIIAVGFGVSLHRSLTGNGLLDENLDTHILAQLDDSGDDTGGDDTGGDDTTGGANPQNPNPYIRHYNIMKDFEDKEPVLSDKNGWIIIDNKAHFGYLPNTRYTVTLRKWRCTMTNNVKDSCDYSKERFEITKIEEGEGTN